MGQDSPSTACTTSTASCWRRTATWSASPRTPRLTTRTTATTRPPSPRQEPDMQKPVIITCAPTGGIHTPTMSPHLPITPEDIATAAVEAAAAGAAVIHLHARNPETGQPDPRPELFL